jgi:hypothetical protein
MTGYIVTIRRDAPHAESGGQTTVRFDLSSGQARVQELIVTAGEGGGLAPADLPRIDLDLLVRALDWGPNGSGTALAAAPVETRPAPGRPGGHLPAQPGHATGPPGQAAGHGTGHGAEPARRRTRGDGHAHAPPDSTGRSYRRMPDAAEVVAAYQKTGSISALAKYYRVPRYTAQGWAGRLRRQGYKIGRA